MLNQVVLVGRLVNELEEKETESGKKYLSIILACPRSFKNADGEYDTDFIECILWQGISEQVKEYCHKEDILGIKGRIQVVDNEMQIIAEKVTVLSSKSNEINKEVNNENN